MLPPLDPPSVPNVFADRDVAPQRRCFPQPVRACDRGGGCATLQARPQRLCNRSGACRVPNRARRGGPAPLAARVTATWRRRRRCLREPRPRAARRRSWAPATARARRRPAGRSGSNRGRQPKTANPHAFSSGVSAAAVRPRGGSRGAASLVAGAHGAATAGTRSAARRKPLC